MKSTIIILLFILLMPCFTQGQGVSKKVDLLFGNELESSRKSTLSDIVGYDDNGFYAIKNFSKGLYGSNTYLTLEYFNNQMNFVKSVKIDLKKDGKVRNIEGIFQLKKKLYLLTSQRDARAKVNYLYLQRFNQKTLKLSINSKKVAAINYEGKTKRNSGDFSYTVSRDSSKVLIYYNLPYERGSEEKFGFHVYSSKFEEVWKREVTLPYKEELFEVEDFNVDNEGNAHLLGLIFKGKRKSIRKGEPNYKYQILSYSNNGQNLTEYPVEIEGNFLNDMQISVSEDQNLICSGFYSEAGTSSIIGSYFLKIDSKTKAIIQKSFKEFGIDFITQNYTAKQERKANKRAEKGKNVELYDYNLDDLILRDDGGAVLIGEQFYVDVFTSTSTNGSRITNYTYHYNDIIVVNISPQGEIEWSKKISKRQITRNDGGFFSSYVLSVVKDKLFFVFNDNPRNVALTDKSSRFVYSGGRESIVILVEVDGNGEISKEPLFSAREAEVIIRPKVCEQLKNDELILFGQRRRKQRFIKANFK